MNITVVLCTYNRCRKLTNALSSLAASRLPESVQWEVLVVDNNSNDKTCEVVEDFCSRYPGRFRYLFEPQAGKSYALNTAIRESHGDIVAFVDDDVTVEPAWLQNLTAPLLENEWAGSGGRTLPAGTFLCPPWLSIKEPYNLGGALCALFDLGDNPHQLDRAPYGTNMAFRRQMFAKYGGFRTDLGPSPCRDIPRPNEDTEFGRRLMAAGERLFYEPSAVVYHPVPDDRLKKKYFLAWWFDYGRAAVREAGKRPDIYGIPRHYFSIPKIIGWTAYTTLQWMLALDSQRRFYLKTHVCFAAGQTVEMCRQSKRTSRPSSQRR